MKRRDDKKEIENEMCLNLAMAYGADVYGANGARVQGDWSYLWPLPWAPKNNQLWKGRERKTR